MERYIGLDVHAQSTAVGVVSESGQKLFSRLVDTSASSLIEVVTSVAGTRRLILEEGTQSAWLSEVLSPHVAELVVTAPTKRDRSQAKNDLADAFARAEELRRNAVDKRIYKPSTVQPLREALRMYTEFKKDSVRAKNRYRAVLRGRGVVLQARSALYDPEPEELEKLLALVPPSVALHATATLEQIYMLEDLRSRARDVLVDEAKQQPAFSHLMTVPGIGDLRAATVLAVVVIPQRFRQSHQFWSYCGLGVQTVVSAEYARGANKGWVRQRTPQTRGLKPGHPQLKEVFKGAAETIATRLVEQPLGQHYRRLLENGMKENLAKLTLARKVAAISLAIWKNQEDYDPTRHNSFQ